MRSLKNSFAFSSRQLFWALLILTQTWASILEPQTPRSVFELVVNTMIWMMLAKMSTTTLSLK